MSKDMLKYSKASIHKKLTKRWTASKMYLANKVGERQALFCPYYVQLSGSLGQDWGVIINPKSKLFGNIVFEHDWCGCPRRHMGNYQEQEDAWMKK